MKTRKAIGIDIGGTKILIGAVESSGEVVHQMRYPTQSKKGFEYGSQKLIENIRHVLSEVSWGIGDISGIGIGCPGPLDIETGTIHNEYTLPSWEGCNLLQPIRDKFQVPIYLENDADAALLGEVFAGAGRGSKHVVMLTFGTGVGGAALVDGQIFRGQHGEHPEIGHIFVESDGPACYCGIHGCLESLASGTAIKHAAQDAGFEGVRDVFEQAGQGKNTAIRIVRRAVNATSMGVWSLIHTFLPEKILLGGGVMDYYYHVFAPELQKKINSSTMVQNSISIVQAQLKNDAGLIGAASLAFRQAASTLKTPQI